MFALGVLIGSLVSMILFAFQFYYAAMVVGFVAALLVLYLIRHRLFELIMFVLVSGLLEYYLVEKGLSPVELVGIGAGIASFIWLLCKLIYHNLIEQKYQDR